MALNADEVLVAITGEIYVAPVGTEAPTSVDSELDEAWIGTGFVSEDGITETYEESSETIQAWQGATTVRTITTESEVQFAFALMQGNRTALELYHKGSQVEAAGGGGNGNRMNVRTPQPDPRSFVIDVIDGDQRLRIYIPRGEVTERGEITYTSDGAVSYNVTVTCSPVTVMGQLVSHVKFSDSPAWDAVPSP